MKFSGKRPMRDLSPVGLVFVLSVCAMLCISISVNIYICCINLY